MEKFKQGGYTSDSVVGNVTRFADGAIYSYCSIVEFIEIFKNNKKGVNMTEQIFGNSNKQKVETDKDIVPDGCCADCKTKIEDGEDVKILSCKIYHAKCYKRVVAKANGRPNECPKCKGVGMYKSESDISTFMPTTLSNSVDCDVCGGFGYTSRKMVPVMKVAGYTISD